MRSVRERRQLWWFAVVLSFITIFFTLLSVHQSVRTVCLKLCRDAFEDGRTRRLRSHVLLFLIHRLIRIKKRSQRRYYLEKSVFSPSVSKRYM